jgi:choline kinase
MEMANTTTAIILVAGIGARLRPLTDDRPKALVDLGGETILGRALRVLSGHGINKVVLATGYREDAVRRSLQNASIRCEYVRNPDYATTQNSVSLALCESAVRGEGFYKLDGDVVFQPEVLARLQTCDAELAVAVDRGRHLDDEAMKVRLAEGSESSIAAFGKGISLAQSAGESIGIERLSRGASEVLFGALRRNLKNAKLDSYYEDVYSELLAEGTLQAQAVDVGDLTWTEIDDREDLERARALFGNSA